MFFYDHVNSSLTERAYVCVWQCVCVAFTLSKTLSANLDKRARHLNGYRAQLGLSMAWEDANKQTKTTARCVGRARVREISNWRKELTLSLSLSVSPSISALTSLPTLAYFHHVTPLPLPLPFCQHLLCISLIFCLCLSLLVSPLPSLSLLLFFFFFILSSLSLPSYLPLPSFLSLSLCLLLGLFLPLSTSLNPFDSLPLSILYHSPSSLCHCLCSFLPPFLSLSPLL